MGYRSNGAFALRREAYDNAMTLEIKLPELLSEMEGPTIREDWVYWEYSGFKMYNDYAVVAELMEFIADFENNDTDDWPDKILWARGATFKRAITYVAGEPSTSEPKEEYCSPKESFEYIRIGEGLGDVEHKGAYELFGVETHLEIY